MPPNPRLSHDVKNALLADPNVEVFPPNWEDEGAFEYFYRPGSFLTRQASEHAVVDALHAMHEDVAELMVTDPRIEPVQPVSRLNGISNIQVAAKPGNTLNLLQRFEGRLGRGVVTLEHVFAVTAGVLLCPATEPEEVLTPQQAEDPNEVMQALWPPIGDPAAGHGIAVSVVDTGLLADVANWAPWLAGVTPGSPNDVEDPDQIYVDSGQRRRDGYADPYAGHGSFIAGVIRCVARGTTVTVERLIEPSGFCGERDIVRQIQQALTHAPSIISMSAGGYTKDDQPPLALEGLHERRLRDADNVVLVAAAGNDGDDRQFWPAASDWCVGVGSTSRDCQHRSDFSNYGPWVNVYAPGEKLVNAYPRLPYKTVVDGEVRDTSAGIVSWSGTSFATPIVSALIAARMAVTGENAHQAKAVVLAGAAQIAGVGPVLRPPLVNA